jgi:hypothetical protein
MKVAIGRFEVSIYLIGSFKSFKPLEITFESSTMALTNLPTYGVAVGVTALAVGVKDEDRYYLPTYIDRFKERTHGFQIHIA